MFHMRKVFCFALFSFICSFGLNAGAQMPETGAKKSPDTSKQMQGRSYAAPQKKEPAQTEKKEDASASEDSKPAEKAEKELSPDEKLLKKYKELLENAKAEKAAREEAEKKEKAGGETKEARVEKGSDEEVKKEVAEIGDEDKNSSEGETDSTDAKAEVSEEEKQAIGIQAILERYQNAQKNKGKMNSRTLGNVD